MEKLNVIQLLCIVSLPLQRDPIQLTNPRTWVVTIPALEFMPKAVLPSMSSN
jgi:hypothetical protein